MAEILIGDILGRIRVDATEWQRGLTAAMQSLQQFGQAKDQIIGNLQRFQQALGTATQQGQQQMQALAQRTQQTAQSFQQLNQTTTQATQQFTQTANAVQQSNTQLTQLNTTISQTTQQANQAGQAAQAFGLNWQHALQIAAGIGIATTVQGIVRTITNLATESVQLAARMQDLSRSFAALEGGGSAAAQTLTNLFSVAQRAGVGFTELAEGFRRLESGARGTTLSHQDLQRAMEGITTGARVLGVSTQESQRALVAWEQILTKGRLSSEELVRQLGNAIPGGLSIVAQSLGVTTAQLRAMAEGGVIPGTLAFVAFSEEMRKLGQGVAPIDGLSATFARLANETKAWMTAFGDAIGTVLGPFLENLVKISEELRTIFGIKPPGATPMSAPGANQPGGLGRLLPGFLTPTTLGTPAPGTYGPTEQPGAAYVPPGGLPVAQSQFTELIRQEAQRAQIDPGLLSQLIRTESAFNPNAVSRAGAVGLGQILPATAESLQPGITAQQLRDPETNIRLAAQYLSRLLTALKDFDDKEMLALASYNAGPKRVADLLEEAGRAGRPMSFAGIQGQLPAETQRYVPNVLGLGGPGGGAGGQASLDAQARIVESWRKEIAATLEITENLKGQVEAIAQSGGNFGTILDRDVAQAAGRLVERFATLQQAFATMPQLANQLPQALREQVNEATKQAAIWQETLMTDTRRRDLLRQQVEQVEQLTIRRQAELVSLRQGQQEAERFARLETARLQQDRIEDRPRLAGMTTQQQIADYEQRLTALQNRANQFGAELEQKRAEMLRPQLEAQLQRVETFMGRPGESQAEQARANVQQQAATIRGELERTLQELARHPGLQDLAERIQNALAGLGEAAGKQAQIAYDRVTAHAQQQVFGLQNQLEQALALSGRAGRSAPEQAQANVLQQGAAAEAQLRKAIEEVQQSLDIQRLAPGLRQQLEDALAGLPEGVQKQARVAFDQMDAQMRDRITGIGDQIGQLQMKIGAAGLSPLQADLERIRREFQAMLDTLDKLEAKLGEEYVRATPERQDQIKAVVDQINAARPQVQPARDAAVEERRLRPQVEYLEQLQRQLEQSQVAALGPATLAGDPRLEVQLAEMRRTKAGEERIQTPEGERKAEELEAQIRAQSRLNYAAGLFVEVGNSVGSAWGQALQGIASGTETVSQAFRQMGQSILMSLTQIASQEAWKAFIGLGLRLVFGAAGGGLTGGIGGGVSGTGPEFTPEMMGGFGDTSWLGGAMGAFAQGGVVDRPTLALIGENPATRPETIVGFPDMRVLAQAMSLPLRQFQEGGQIDAPTLAVLGEDASTRPEIVLNKQQMDQVLSLLHDKGAPQTNDLTQALAWAKGTGQGLQGEAMGQLTAVTGAIQGGQQAITNTLQGVQHGAMQQVHRADPRRHLHGIEDLPQMISRFFGRIFHFQDGGIINKPTLAYIGENSANNPEVVMNRHQMAGLMDAAIQRAPSAGGQAAGGVQLTNIFVRSQAEAEDLRRQEEAAGRIAVISVMKDMARGESSQIVRQMRTLQR